MDVDQFAHGRNWVGSVTTSVRRDDSREHGRKAARSMRDRQLRAAAGGVLDPLEHISATATR